MRLKKENRYRVLATILMIGLVLLLAGCGSKADKSTQVSEQSTDSSIWAEDIEEFESETEKEETEAGKEETGTDTGKESAEAGAADAAGEANAASGKKNAEKDLGLQKIENTDISAEYWSDSLAEAYENGAKDSTEGKILVLYFSKGGWLEDSGFVVKGNTQTLAEIITEKTGADLCELQLANKVYPSDYDDLIKAAQSEKDQQARPAYVKNLPDLTLYDNIFVGAPIWCNDWPMVMYTFFENEDLLGKNLIPFYTGGKNSVKEKANADNGLIKTCADSSVLTSLALEDEKFQAYGDEVSKEVEKWVSSLDY